MIYFIQIFGSINFLFYLCYVEIKRFKDMKITKEQLNDKFIELCNKMNYPTTKEIAIDQNKEFYYELNYSPVYGYIVYKINVVGGSCLTPFNDFIGRDRVNIKTMYIIIQSILTGIYIKETI